MEETTPMAGTPQEQLPARTPLHEATEQGAGQGQEIERPAPAAQTLLDIVRDDWS